MNDKVETEWLTTAQAATLINVQEVTLASMRSRGQGPVYYKVGQAVKYQEKDVLEWYEAKRKPIRVVPGEGK